MKQLLSIIAVLVLFSACRKSHSDDPEVPVRRTVIVYMAGENNLTSYAQSDIEEMIQGAKGMGNDCRLLIFVDRASATEKPFLARITSDSKQPIDTLYKYQADFYTADAQRFQEVLSRARALCPAQDYGLVLWGHANGWIIRSDSATNTPTYAPRRAYGVDSGNNTSSISGRWMNIPSMAKALQELGIKFKFILSDCCNMQNIETAYELRKYADYLIGSPAEITGSGAPYEKVVKDFFLTDDEQLYKGICDDYNAQVDLVGGHLPINVIKTDCLEQLANATRKVLPLIATNLPKDDFDKGHIYYYCMIKSDGWSYIYPKEEKTLYDMNDIIRWGLDDNVAAYEEWHTALSDAVIYNKMSTYWHANSIQSDNASKTFVDFTVTTENYGGVSMFFPLTKYDTSKNLNLYNYNQDIKKMQWYYAVGWSEVDW